VRGQCESANNMHSALTQRETSDKGKIARIKHLAFIRDGALPQG